MRVLHVHTVFFFCFFFWWLKCSVARTHTQTHTLLRVKALIAESSTLARMLPDRDCSSSPFVWGKISCELAMAECKSYFTSKATIRSPPTFCVHLSFVSPSFLLIFTSSFECLKCPLATPPPPISLSLQWVRTVPMNDFSSHETIIAWPQIISTT